MNYIELINLKGKGLLVFSDPGAAKAVLSLGHYLKLNNQSFIIVSDRYYDFFDMFDVDVLLITENAESILCKYKPDFVFTGTSYTSNIEKDFISASKGMNIHSFSFVDHWTSIIERFKLNNNFVFPDQILLIDETAKKIAIESGINDSILVVFGNPYYDFLKKWKPKLTKNELFKFLNLDVNHHKIIIYAPDPLSNVNGLDVFGFDEINLTQQIDELLNELNLPINFILKLHPNQEIKKLLPYTSSKIIIADKTVDSNSLIYYSDSVWGFFSNFLIEAQIMNKPIMRVLSNNIINDPFRDKEIGEIVYLNQLKSYLIETYGK